MRQDDSWTQCHYEHQRSEKMWAWLGDPDPLARLRGLEVKKGSSEDPNRRVLVQHHHFKSGYESEPCPSPRQTASAFSAANRLCRSLRTGGHANAIPRSHVHTRGARGPLRGVGGGTRKPQDHDSVAILTNRMGVLSSGRSAIPIPRLFHPAIVSGGLSTETAQLTSAP